VVRHKGTFAAHAYGGFIAILTAFCEREQIDYAAIPVGTIKKHWVDDGRATKAQMMEEALGRGFNITTDNEADALAILDYARKKYAVESDGWIKPNTFIRRTSSGGQILQKGRRKSAPLKTLYQLVPLAHIPKRLRFYEDAAKVVQRRMVPNFKKSFERAVRTARLLTFFLTF
jgi:hypothetical protein